MIDAKWSFRYFLGACTMHELMSSFTTLNRCFQELMTFWSLLFFSDDCNVRLGMRLCGTLPLLAAARPVTETSILKRSQFLLSTRFLSYHEVFSLLVLGCVCLYDLILFI